MARFVLIALAALCLASCDDAITEVVLVVNSDLSTPDEIDSVEVTVTAPDERVQTAVATFDAESPTFPRTIGIERGTVDGEYVVELVAKRGNLVIVRRKARFRFTSGERRMLRVSLLDACRGVVCAGDTTCGNAAFCERPTQSTEAFDADAINHPDAGL